MKNEIYIKPKYLSGEIAIYEVKKGNNILYQGTYEKCQEFKLRKNELGTENNTDTKRRKVPRRD